MVKVDLTSLVVAAVFLLAVAVGAVVLVKWVGLPGWAAGLCGLIFGALTIGLLILVVSRQA